MKEYFKPTLDIIEIRPDERLAWDVSANIPGINGKKYTTSAGEKFWVFGFDAFDKLMLHISYDSRAYKGSLTDATFTDNMNHHLLGNYPDVFFK